MSAQEAALANAQQELAAAQAALDEVTRGGPPSQADIVEARNQLDIAIAQRDEALAVDTSAERAAVSDAEQAAATASAALSTAQAASATPLPAQEVVWLEDLPRRVDEVLVSRGAVVDGAMLKVSGADLSVTARVSADEVALLKDGMPARLTIPGSADIEAVVSKVGGTPAPGTDDEPDTDGGQRPTGTAVVLQPQNVSTEQAQALRGSNVKVTIPVASTSGDVLVVPVVALFSDAGGTPRVEVYDPDAAVGTRFQPVAVGLSAGGEVEVSPVDDAGATLLPSATTLDKGSLVVVGR